MDYFNRAESRKIKLQRKRNNLIIAGLIACFVILVYFITLVRVGDMGS